MTQEKFLEIVKFCFVGIISLVLDYTMIFCLTEFLEIHYLQSSMISYISSMIFNYFLCRRYVFKNTYQTVRQVIFFFAASLISLGINQFCIWVFTEIFELYYMFAKIISSLTVTIWNYITKRKAIFS